MGKVCWNCGKKNKAIAQFCPWCGARLDHETSQSQHYVEKRDQAMKRCGAVFQPLKKETAVAIGIVGAGGVVVLFLLIIIAIMNRGGINATGTDSVPSLTEEENWNLYETNEQNLPNQEVLQKEGERIIGQIEGNTFCTLINSLADGTLWIRVHDYTTEESYFAHVTPYGELLFKKPQNEIYGARGQIYMGLNEKEVLVGGGPYHVFDLENDKDITEAFLNGYDEIHDYHEDVLVIRKKVDTFEESYYCLGLVNNEGENIFEISLDANTLLEQYGMSSAERVDTIDALNEEAGIYAIELSYDASLLIDLKRNKVIPVREGNLAGNASSDGDYTVVANKVINHSTGEQNQLYNDHFILFGSVSENKFPAYRTRSMSNNAVVLLDIEGRELADLSQYNQQIFKIEPFYHGVAFIEWRNGFIGFINENGELMCEPRKAHETDNKCFYKDIPVALFATDTGEHVHMLTPDGETREIDGLPNHASYIYDITYEGKDLLVYLGEDGMTCVEAPDLSGVVSESITNSSADREKIESGSFGEWQDITEDYILPDAASSYYTFEELKVMSDEELRTGRNEILARHGRTFRDQGLQEYFDSKSWYQGLYSPDEFDSFMETVLNDYEKKNIELIKKIEAER